MNLPTLRITYAQTPLKRMRGLLGKKCLCAGEALLIRPCNAIHTLGMKFALDVRFYDRKGQLMRTYTNVSPGKWFLWGGWKAHAVLESQAGDVAFSNLTQLPQNEK